MKVLYHATANENDHPGMQQLIIPALLNRDE